MTRLIGLTGKARAGKDTFAGVLCKFGFKRIAFADALKEATSAIAGEPSHYFFDDTLKEEHSPTLGTTRRLALQAIGKSVRDNLDEGVWVRRALATWEDAGCPPIVVSDVRYDNEAHAILAAGGIVVRILRPGHEGLTGAAAAHESERGVSDDLVSVEIVNDGSVSELVPEARKVLAFVDPAFADQDFPSLDV